MITHFGKGSFKEVASCRSQRGFTLIELLVVMAIIVLMAVAAVAVSNSNVAATSSKQAAVMAANVLTLTRSEAIQTQNYSALIVDAYPDPTNPGNFLHRFMVANSTSGAPGVGGTNTFQQLSVWYIFPSSVYFDANYSGSSSSTIYYPVTIALNNGGSFSGPAYVYSFGPSGQLTTPGAFVVAVGHQSASVGTAPSTPIYEDGTLSTPNTLQGFYIHSAGRPSFFQLPSSITPVSTH